VTSEDPAVVDQLDQVVLMVVPTHNPDGMDMVVENYRASLGTPFEGGPLPGIYNRYTGHDNNRDYFMMNLPETRAVSRMLFREWFPQIVYNHHQTGPAGTVMFAPPFRDPFRVP
jgi:murein tripeptide amidase MpaA